MSQKFTDVEMQALQYLAESPDGRNMVSHPALVSALMTIAKFKPRALLEFSKPDGQQSVLAQISDHGRAVVQEAGKR